MGSFSLLNTNVSLTSNVKLVVDSNDKLYLDSIDSDVVLSNEVYKKYKISSDSMYSDVLHNFWKGLDRNYVYKIYNRDDVNMTYTDFREQYDDLYLSGARYVQNKSYEENFEIFAPLYIDKLSIPKYFLIFKVDGSGIVDLNKNNIKSEFINKFKCVKYFKLDNTTKLGNWLNRNYVENQSFNGLSMNFDFRKDEFIKWYGIDYINGGYLEMSLFNNEIIDREHLYKDFNDIISNGYKNNNLIFPNILNISYLFNDISGVDKWKLNQYSGYYMDDLEKSKTFTISNTFEIKDDFSYKIDENNCIYIDNSGVFDYNIEPFDFGYQKNNDFYNYIYVELFGIFYKVERIKYLLNTDGQIFENNDNLIIEQSGNIYGYKYKIISNVLLNQYDLNLFNKSNIYIDPISNEIYYIIDNNPILSFEEYSKCDVWILNIDGIFHNIVGRYENSIFKTFINSDYNFTFDTEKVIYYVGNNISRIDINISVNNLPKSIELYKCVFTDIKQFDSDIIDTEYSRYEYEINDKISSTDEPKMYMNNLNSTSHPKDIDDYIYSDEVVNIPVSSEYISTTELFSIENDSLNNLWKKNPSNIKWCFENSISSYDYPYMINLNTNSEDYNRTCSLDNYFPDNMDRNLDYFYTLLRNDLILNYDFQSLNINDTFSIKDYIESKDINYFRKLFRSSIILNEKKINYNKFGKFVYSDGSITNSVLFRGIKFNIHKVDNVKVLNGDVDRITYNSTNNFNGYDFSILLSENEYSVTKSNIDGKFGITSSSINSFSWKTIDDIGSKKIIKNGDFILSNSIIYEYIGTDDLSVDDFTEIEISPDNGFIILSDNLIFWNPNTTSQYVYYNGEYYIYDTQPGLTIDFWNPHKLDYNNGDVVYYNGSFYSYSGSSIIQYSDSIIVPNNNILWELSNDDFDNFKWKVVNIWIPTTIYNNLDYVYNDGILYRSIVSNNDNIIGDLESWEIVYNIQFNTNIVYNSGIDNNSIFIFNNTYYLCTSNDNNKTLENGIVVYINNIHKNILINIYINDNTYNDDIFNERFKLYDNKIYSKLTSTNLINVINNLNDNGGFSDLVKYVIIDIDGVNLYDQDNIELLPYILSCDVTPDLVKIKNNTLQYEPINISSNILKSNTKLDNGNIRDISMINWYNQSLPIASKISYNTIFNENIINFHGMSRSSYICLYRYSGYYSPIFKNINIFNYDDQKNYRFDVELFEFGMFKRLLSSKVNRNGDILRLVDNKDYQSIYPMMNEYGYLFIDRFVFKSSWDLKYFTEIIK